MSSGAPPPNRYPGNPEAARLCGNVCVRALAIFRTGPAPDQARQQRLPQEEWKIRIHDKYPAYISWATYEQIQALLDDNYADYQQRRTRGVPRSGKALLQGLLYCGQCGHKLVVQYHPESRYVCNHLRLRCGEPVCQHFPTDPLDTAVVQAFFAAAVTGRTGCVPSGNRRGATPRAAPGFKPSVNSWSGCATRPPWPSGSTGRSIPITAWWRQS